MQKPLQFQLLFAINKIDRPNANPEKVKQQLTEIWIGCRRMGRGYRLRRSFSERENWD